MSSGASVRGPRRDPDNLLQRRRRKMEISPAGLHRYLWSRSDQRGRVDLDIDVVSMEFDVSYPIANRAVKLVRSEGRIKLVAWKRERQAVYQVADPEKWRLTDPTTHARENTEPVWG